jgi:hypothetical protein
MSIGKYISLEEARKKNKLDRFIKAHPSEGNEQQFNQLLDNMTHNRKPKKLSKGSRTSK